MNNFFNDIGKVVNRVANSVGTEIDVVTLEHRVREGYQTLGKLYYEAVQAGRETAGPEFDTQMQKIGELLETIRTTRENQKTDEV
jgi:hypothetical protein